MARRGNNLFKKHDGKRAIQIAREGGIEPAMIEIVAKDGTVYRVYGDNAPQVQTLPGAEEWEAAEKELPRPRR